MKFNVCLLLVVFMSSLVSGQNGYTGSAAQESSYTDGVTSTILYAGINLGYGVIGFIFSPLFITLGLTAVVMVILVEKYKIHCAVDSEVPGSYAHKLKYAIYEEIIPGAINPLMKSTGFERLKKYLASQSGIYNTFDLKYRAPMVLEHRKTQRNTRTDNSSDGSAAGTDGTVRFKAGKLPQELTERYRNAILEHNSESIYEYYFDF